MDVVSFLFSPCSCHPGAELHSSDQQLVHIDQCTFEYQRLADRIVHPKCSNKRPSGASCTVYCGCHGRHVGKCNAITWCAEIRGSGHVNCNTECSSLARFSKPPPAKHFATRPAAFAPPRLESAQMVPRGWCMALPSMARTTQHTRHVPIQIEASTNTIRARACVFVPIRPRRGFCRSKTTKNVFVDIQRELQETFRMQKQIRNTIDAACNESNSEKA